MLDMGMMEIMVIGVVALIVVGPKDLPRMLRTLGQYTGKMRGMAREFKRSMDDAAREADLDEFKDIQKSLNDVRAIGSDAAQAVQQGVRQVNSDIEDAAKIEETKPEPAPETPPAGIESTSGDLVDNDPAPAPPEKPAEEPAKTTTGSA